MNQIFKDEIGNILFVYLDDITIYSQSFEQHLEDVERVLRILRAEGFCVKAKKCTFASNEVELLGHIINDKGIQTSDKKIRAIRDYPRPTSRTEVRSFLGLAGYYRSFVEGFSVIAKPLNELLRTDKTFCWTGEQADYWTPEREKAFRELKSRLITAPILA